MSKFIDAEDACAEVDCGDLLVGNNAEWAKEIIRRTRSAEVVEVRHGYWIRVRGEYNQSLGVKCSECGRRVRNRGERYCPNCGTKMDGKAPGE